jgi:hypothetical protein
MTDTLQSQLLTALLARHPRLIDASSLPELLAEHGHPDVNASELESALTSLLGDGLATRLGDLVGASWIAARATRLNAP